MDFHYACCPLLIFFLTADGSIYCIWDDGIVAFFWVLVLVSLFTGSDGFSCCFTLLHLSAVVAFALLHSDHSHFCDLPVFLASDVLRLGIIFSLRLQHLFDIDAFLPHGFIWHRFVA
ncbi:hypothetical protein C8Q69DRAFT_26769 [Paecilomyces variotii]|uniref:Uncharacterized protein n=1 Tax=Byssochlamys spectabilis TaxID=264951 RepID=A0A443I5T7_BYSSP|nr:hypothetical protein C8Q69DRAFT_26769 [Paecilomyces variotii]RWQ99470.1 hypothetical protein C8Q69DRAFT_26769 [Paecilomyces variotii]